MSIIDLTYTFRIDFIQNQTDLRKHKLNHIRSAIQISLKEKAWIWLFLLLNVTSLTFSIGMIS
jgi:hypothetical protein